MFRLSLVIFLLCCSFYSLVLELLRHFFGAFLDVSQLLFSYVKPLHLPSRSFLQFYHRTLNFLFNHVYQNWDNGEASMVPTVHNLRRHSLVGSCLYLTASASLNYASWVSSLPHPSLDPDDYSLPYQLQFLFQ